jgi:signal transduction histidine kinase
MRLRFEKHFSKTLFFIFAFSCCVQFNLFARSNDAEEKAELLFQSCDDYLDLNKLDTLLIKTQNLLKFSQVESLLNYEGFAKYLFGRYYLSSGNFDSSLYYFTEAENIFHRVKDTLEQGKMNFFMGYIHKNNGRTTEALECYHKSADLLEMTSDTKWYGVVCNYMGNVYSYQGNYFMALQNMHKSLAALRLLNDSTRVGGVYNALGVIYRKTKDKQKEEEAYLLAIAHLLPAGYTLHLGEAYNNLSEVYFNKGEIEKAFETLELARETYKAIDYQLGLCTYFAVLANYHTKTKPPDYWKVIEYGEKSVAIAEEFSDMRQYADATSFLGKAYMETGQVVKAEQVLKKGLAAAEEGGFLREIVVVTEILSEFYNRTKQAQKAYNTLKMYIQFKDSIVGEEKIKEFTSLDLGFKFRQQQLSDSLNNAQHLMEIEFQHDNEIQTQQQLNYFFLVISLLVVGFAVYMFIARRRLKNSYQLLSEKNEQISKQKTEIETYSKKIKQAYSKLQKLDEYKQAMVSMLAHDLKNPLNILTNIDVFEDIEEIKQMVNHIGKQMLNLVMNLLDVNSAENNSLTLNKSEINFKDVVDSSIQEVEFLCVQKNIVIEVEPIFNFIFQADEELLIRVFVNLFSNAIKFSSFNSTIIIDARVEEGQGLVISIKDEGSGIAIEHHEIIFEKFKQINIIKSGEVASTGLGLAFCKMAVELHGWTIGVDSSVGEGAKFWIRVADFQTIESDSQKLTTPVHVDVRVEDKTILPEDLIKLDPYLQKLDACGVFAISEIKVILMNIEVLNIEGLDQWLEEVRLATEHIDEDKFDNLINMFIS